MGGGYPRAPPPLYETLVFKEVTDIVEVGTQEGQTENPSVFKEVTDIVEVGTQEGQTETPSSVFKEVTDIVEVETQVPAVEPALTPTLAPLDLKGIPGEER